VLPRRRVRPATVAVAVVLIALTGMWVYAFFFADRHNPDVFPDRAWAERADAVCERYVAQVDALPSARSFRDIEPKSLALAQRADVADQVTEILRQMVAELQSVPPADELSITGVRLWYDDWQLHLADRDRHTDSWRAGVDEPFAETAVRGREVGKGVPVTIRMDNFAEINGMPSCSAPRDIG